MKEKTFEQKNVSETEDQLMNQKTKNKTIVIILIIIILILSSYYCFLSSVDTGNEERTVALSSEDVDNVITQTSSQISGDMATYINNYFEQNNISKILTDDDVSELTDIVVQGITQNEEYIISDADISTIKTSVTNDVKDMFTVDDTSDISYLTDEIRNYVSETIVANITSIALDAETTKANLEETQEQLTTATLILQSQSDALDEKIIAAQSNYEDLQERLSEVAKQLTDTDNTNEETIAGLAQELVLLQTDLATANTNLSALQLEKEELSLSIAENSTNIATANENITTALSNIDETNKNLESSNEETSAGIFSNLTSIISNTNAISTNADSIASNSSLISALEEEKLSVGELNSYLLDLCYPIGSVYMSASNVSPASFLGGTWEQITDTTLVGAGNKYASGSTGGATSITLSAKNIPSITTYGSTTSANVTTSSNGAGNYNLINGWSTSYTGTTSTDGNHYHNMQDVGVYWGYPYGNGELALQWNNISDNAIERTDYAGAHSHTFTVPSLAVSGYVSIGNHSHTLTIPSVAATTSYTNDAIESINIQDPYTAVYMWKRVS